MATEKRLNDANALMDTVEGVNWYHIDKMGYLSNGANSQQHTPLFVAEDIFQAIRNAPTVDAVEVVHGRWIEKMDMVASYLAGCEETFCECSVCNSPNYGETLYCPNCGAKMDGDGNG